MAVSKEVRLLSNKWHSGQGWPKRLEWVEIDGLRGWSGQRIDFSFPIVALVGENGVGKSTVLQALASTYQSGRESYFASDFFPDTIWEQVTGATIKVSIREGSDNSSIVSSVRKPSNRWRGNPERRARNVVYIDLRRIQPIAARTGYARLAKPQLTEASANTFDAVTLQRLSSAMGRKYEFAKLSKTNMDETRAIPVLQRDGESFSGFHQGAGEVAMAELLKHPIPKYSIVLIDEIETSFHPRVQRRLIRDLANLCRDLELQMVVTTHSPYVLAELPPDARIYIMEGAGGKQIIKGVSPEFAMTKMDEEQHPEGDLYVEDARASGMLREIIVSLDKELISRVQIVPFGAASVGRALGMMAKQKRFPRPSIVFLDGDQSLSDGCLQLPGGDAPERVIFDSLGAINWNGVPQRVGRGTSEVIDACTEAMTIADHHDWVKAAADKLVLGTDVLWQALCAQWALACLRTEEGKPLVDSILDALNVA